MNDRGEPARWLRAIGSLCALFLGISTYFPGSSAIQAAEPSETEASSPAKYCTPRLCVHTDLASSDAEALLKRLDGTLEGAARFFGRPPRDSIELFVADRLDQWPSESFTHPAARLLIGGVGGGVVTNGFDDSATTPRKVIVFAAALPGIPEHEVVHAYCVQTFGLCGPTWFKEGIAEMLAEGARERSPVQCPEDALQYLQKSEPRTLREITSTGAEFTAPLAASLLTMLEQHGSNRELAAVASMDAWRDEHTEIVRAARLEYHWCWSACHFLYQHPAYNCRFKLLARGYVGGQPVTFDDAYGAVGQRLEFEYRFFIERIEPGYRVDLCAWDWRDPRDSRKGKRPPHVNVVAARGYQPTGLDLHEGDRLGFSAEGEWRLAADAPSLDADGDTTGAGRLEGVLLDGYSLSEPFELGREGQLEIPAGGKLYLRCRDGWGQLADNRGVVRVMLRKSSQP